MLHKLKQRTEGFTIIEVLIVLAIAGLIILIVLLAVPALQRNARNTQRKGDIGKALALVSEFSNNNNGTLPDQASCFGTMIIAHSGSGYQAVTADGAYYCKATGTSLSWNNTVTTNTTTVDSVTFRSGAVCSGTSGDATTTGASARNVVALFTLENGIKQCQAS